MIDDANNYLLNTVFEIEIMPNGIKMQNPNCFKLEETYTRLNYHELIKFKKRKAFIRKQFFTERRTPKGYNWGIKVWSPLVFF